MSSKTMGFLGVCAIAAVGTALWYLHQPAPPNAIEQPVGVSAQAVPSRAARRGDSG